MKIKSFLTIFILLILVITPSFSIFAQSVPNIDFNLDLIKKSIQNYPREYYSEKSYNGYTIFSPEASKNIYVMDNHGKIINSWRSKYRFTASTYLLENGNMIHSCSIRRSWKIKPFKLCKGACGRIEMFDWDGNLIWEYENIDSYTSIHNDFEVMPNGNILMTYWRAKTREEALQAGCMEELIHPKDNNKLTGSVIEVKPIYPKGGEIVWQWHAWDHLIQDYDPSKDNYGNVSQHPELIDINIPVLSEPTWPFLEYDQLHINAIDYNPDLDQILICPRNLNEILVIDHNTTTEEAAGHYGGRYEKGGDILYRWGNPRNYDRGNESDQQLFAQHDAQWISPDCPGAGNIILYNNGFGRPGEDYSSIVEFVPPVDDNGSYILEDNCSFGPKEPVWEYKSSNPELFYSAYASGCQRLPNGNTFICSGTKGTFYEVTSDKEVVWKHMSRFPFPLIDFNIVFKAQHVGADFPGLKI